MIKTKIIFSKVVMFEFFIVNDETKAINKQVRITILLSPNVNVVF